MITINGNVFGGAGIFVVGVSSGVPVTVNGSVTGGAGEYAAGVQAQEVVVNGPITGGAGVGAFGVAGGRVTVTGPLAYSATGTAPVAGEIVLKTPIPAGFAFPIKDDAGAVRAFSLGGGAPSVTLPAPADVRLNVRYGANDALVGTALLVPAPALSTQTMVWCRCWDAHGALAAGARITIELVSAPGGTGDAYDKTPIVAISGADGIASAAIVRGEGFKLRCRSGQGDWVMFDSKDIESFELPHMAGKGG